MERPVFKLRQNPHKFIWLFDRLVKFAKKGYFEAVIYLYTKMRPIVNCDLSKYVLLNYQNHHLSIVFCNSETIF